MVQACKFFIGSMRCDRRALPYSKAIEGMERRISESAKAKEVAAKPRARLSRVRLQHQRASALCQTGKVECVGGEPSEAPAEHRTQGVERRLAPVATALCCRVLRTARSALARSPGSCTYRRCAPVQTPCPDLRTRPIPEGPHIMGCGSVGVRVVKILGLSGLGAKNAHRFDLHRSVGIDPMPFGN